MNGPAFLTTPTVVERLGISQTMFYTRRSALEAEGFPKPDPVLKRYLSEDIEAWLKSRRRVADPDRIKHGGTEHNINFDAL